MITVTTYSQAEEYITAFAQGNINLLLIEGTGGTGKTVTTTKVLEKLGVRFRMIAGHITPLDFYKTLYRYRAGYVFVLDDIDALLKNPIHTSLLKQLCDTKAQKQIQYHTTSSKIEDVPDHFTIDAPIVILANRISKMSDDIQALFTRGIHIQFCPTPYEVVTRAKQHLRLSKDVITFAEQHLPVITTIDLRKLILADNLLDSSIGWKDWFRNELGISSDYEVVLKVFHEFTTYKDRIKAFRERTGKSEPTYNRYVKQLHLSDRTPKSI